MSSNYRVLQQYISPEFILQSRLHRLNHVFTDDATVYIKREDELSSGIAGSKYRKFASLIPFFRQEAFDEIVVIGGAQSNNVVAALQLLNENQFPAKLFLLQSNEKELKGNLLWISLLHDLENIIWIARDTWPEVNDLAHNYAREQLQNGKRVFILEEGAAVIEALPGAASLAFDISANETANNLAFQHVFIDSGTGVSAIGLLLGYQLVEKQCQVHVTLIAGTEQEFRDRYIKLVAGFQKWTGIEVPGTNWQNVHFYQPAIARSFGSITKTVLDHIKKISREEGLLMDPVYSVKHYVTAMEEIEKQKLTGEILFIYNGGSLALSGFMEKIAALH